MLHVHLQHFELVPEKHSHPNGHLVDCNIVFIDNYAL